ncbi:hypothetical protein D7V94_18970 [Parablautia intestinalis]|uniref:Uncharacterized protein n=1 Tax=Parablautia intestinalis TaxID=2320100 RepID=A0A3A9AMH6_9FIRM|nr:hypothetical protein [Parablautia intestinalis]RKI88661.1 hypothetical protein D7V94_18970 [Parablautia intestinalis]
MFKITIFICIGVIILSVSSYINLIKTDRELDKAIILSRKHFSMFYIMNNWLQAKQQGKYMDIYLKKRGFQKVAIYGMHYIGERLYYELENTEIKVVYGIDKNKDISNCPLTIYSPDDKLPIADVIIVTTPLYHYSVKRALREVLNVPIISISEAIEGMERDIDNID